MSGYYDSQDELLPMLWFTAVVRPTYFHELFPLHGLLRSTMEGLGQLATSTAHFCISSYLL